MYICIYIYSIQQEINFFSKSFRERLSQLNIYIKILLQLSNLQIALFLQILIFHYYRNGNTIIKKLTKRQLHITKRNNTNND